MRTCATNDVFQEAAGGVGRGRARPSYGTAVPDLPGLSEPVCASEDTVTGRWTAHGTQRGDRARVGHRVGRVGSSSEFEGARIYGHHRVR
jgi:hypothetical protein